MSGALREPILITGAAGQLGSELVRIGGERGLDLIPFTRDDADFAEPGRALESLSEKKPGTIIHCAAMTRVDDCETERDRAYLLNANACRVVARAAAQRRARVLSVSTDYIFDGDEPAGYDEFADPNPRSVYGRSKLAGERAILEAHPEHIVARTSWVFGPGGANFVKTILRLAARGKDLTIVADQVGYPSYAPDLASNLYEVLASPIAGPVHVTGGGPPASWYELGKAAVELAGFEVKVEPVGSEAYPRPAPRPACSVLIPRVLRMHGLKTCRPWREALAEYVSEHRPWEG